MMQVHLDRAVKETCPFGKTACVMAHLGACAAVDVWRDEHRGMLWTWSTPYDLGPAQREQRREAGRRGGVHKAERERMEVLFG